MFNGHRVSVGEGEEVLEMDGYEVHVNELNATEQYP